MRVQIDEKYREIAANEQQSLFHAMFWIVSDSLINFKMEKVIKTLRRREGHGFMIGPARYPIDFKWIGQLN